MFSSAVLSRDSDSEFNMDDFVVIENVLEEVTDECNDQVDGNIEKRVQSEYFTENIVGKNNIHTFETPKENPRENHYVQFDNEYEINNSLNEKANSDYYSESSSDSSSEDSISFRRIVLTPIQENEVKLSNGYDICNLACKFPFVKVLCY